MGGRRQLDWIQFGILLCAILTLIGAGFVESGRIMQQLDDEARAVENVQQRLSNLEAQWERFQATHQSYQQTP